MGSFVSLIVLLLFTQICLSEFVCSQRLILCNSVLKVSSAVHKLEASLIISFGLYFVSYVVKTTEWIDQIKEKLRVSWF